MRRSTAGADRLITFLIAVVLIVGGLLAILWRCDISWAKTVFAHAEPRWYQDAPQQTWWDWALAGVTIATFALGLWLLMVNLRPNRLGDVTLAGTDPVGALSVSPQQVGNAVVTDLERTPEIRSASAKTTIDRGQRMLRITLKSDPDVPLHRLRSIAADSARQIDAALDGGEVATQFFVEYQPAGKAQ